MQSLIVDQTHLVLVSGAGTTKKLQDREQSKKNRTFPATESRNSKSWQTDQYRSDLIGSFKTEIEIFCRDGNN